MACRIKDLLAQLFGDFDWLKDFNCSPLVDRFHGSIHDSLHVAITTYSMLHKQHQSIERTRRVCLGYARDARETVTGFIERTAAPAHIDDERHLCAIKEVDLFQVLRANDDVGLKTTFCRYRLQDCLSPLAQMSAGAVTTEQSMVRAEGLEPSWAV
jgi:hypothetical protein